MLAAVTKISKNIIHVLVQEGTQTKIELKMHHGQDLKPLKMMIKIV